MSPLAAIDEAVRVLAGHPNATVRQIGAWLVEAPRAGLMEHLGFKNAPGYSAAVAIGLTERDRLLRTYAAKAWPELSPTQQARVIAPRLARYTATRWQRDRIAGSCPYDADDQRAVFWRVLRLADRPLSERRLRAVLTAVAI